MPNGSTGEEHELDNSSVRPFFYALNRTNSVTGVPYRDERAILCWQLGSEMGHMTKVAPKLVVAWENEMAAVVKQLESSAA